jgi:hypothetical protein
MSIGNLKNPDNCRSIKNPAVIDVSQGEKYVDVDVNMCNVTTGINSVTMEIEVEDITIAKAEANPDYHPQLDPREIMVEKGPIVPDDWSLYAGFDESRPNVYTILLKTEVIPLTSIEQSGVLVTMTFEAVSDNPADRTAVVFPKEPALESFPDEPGPPTRHEVELVENEIALPVTLSALGAMMNVDGGIRIFWEAESQRGNLGWNIYRSETKDGKFVKINGDLIKGAGTTAIPIKYDFVDKDAVGGKIYYYLENISFEGEKYRSHIIEAILVNQLTSWGTIKNSSLRQTPLTSKETQKSIMFVKIYDAKGNLVKNLKK